jgi:hypothetical protein
MMSSPALTTLVEDALRILDDMEDDYQSVTHCHLFPARRLKRTVTFSGIISAAPTLALADMSSEEIELCWWSKKEQEATRRAAAALIDVTSYRGHDFVQKTLGRAFDVASSRRAARNDSDSLDVQVLSKHMKHWVFQCNGLRGLEMTVLSHPQARQLINEQRRIILWHYGNSESEELARKVSRRISLTSAMFARMMAIGDEMLEKSARELTRVGADPCNSSHV